MRVTSLVLALVFSLAVPAPATASTSDRVEAVRKELTPAAPLEIFAGSLALGLGAQGVLAGALVAGTGGLLYDPQEDHAPLWFSFALMGTGAGIGAIGLLSMLAGGGTLAISAALE